jgi:hypothetical protein
MRKRRRKWFNPYINFKSTELPPILYSNHCQDLATINGRVVCMSKWGVTPEVDENLKKRLPVIKPTTWRKPYDPTIKWGEKNVHIETQTKVTPDGRTHTYSVVSLKQPQKPLVRPRTHAKVAKAWEPSKATTSELVATAEAMLARGKPLDMSEVEQVAYNGYATMMLEGGLQPRTPQAWLEFYRTTLVLRITT